MLGIKLSDRGEQRCFPTLTRETLLMITIHEFCQIFVCFSNKTFLITLHFPRTNVTLEKIQILSPLPVDERITRNVLTQNFSGS